MTTPLVIGISGKIGSGKSTLSASLKERLELQSRTVYERNFADRLKELVAYHFDIGLDRCYTEAGKNSALPERYGMTVGRALQLFGTALRGVDERLWIHSVADFIERKSASDDRPLVFVVPDCRFPNELAWIHDMHGFVVRLEGDPGGVRRASTRDQTHVSETALDGHEFDLVLNTDMYDVRECVDRVMARIPPLPNKLA